MSKNPPGQVIICGAGPCGLMTALLLARAGISVLVFEKHPGISRHPKAMGVSRRTAEIYAQQDLLEHIKEGSLEAEGHSLGIWSKSLVGEELGRVALSELHSIHTPQTSLHCPQTWVEKVLLDALLKEQSATVRFGEEVLSVEAGSDLVRVVLRSGEAFEAPWFVAADGASSGVRRQLGIEAEGPGDMGHFVNVMFRASYGKHLKKRQAILYHTLSEEGFENFVVVDGNDLWLMHHFLQPGESIEDYSPERFSEIIRSASGLPEEPVEVLGLSPWVMSPKVAKTVRHGRILLAGDAAARLSPAGGLGLNTGLQSVHNLAWKLAAVVKGEAGEALLDTYQSERTGVALNTMRNTNGNAEEIYEIISVGLQGQWEKVRELIAHSRRGGSGLGQDLGVRYTEGAFLGDGTDVPPVADPINEYVPSASPGGRAPHLWANDKGRSILDFFGREFCLLIGRDGACWRKATGVSLVQNGHEFDAEDFEKVYGISRDGAVLVRPDGYVAARYFNPPGKPDVVLEQDLDLILRLRPDASR